MLEDFISWMSNLNESTDGLLGIAPQPGDLVFFGIHLLAKYNKENGSFPRLTLGQAGENAIDVSSMVTPIMEVDPLRHEVLVEPQKSPFSMGYRTPALNSRDRQNRIHIPVALLPSKVTHLFDGESKSIWLLISNNKYQGNLILKLRKFEQMQSKQAPQEPIQQPTPQVPQQPTQNNINAVRAFLSADAPNPQQPILQSAILDKRPPLGDFLQRRKLFNHLNAEATQSKKEWPYY